MRFLATAARGTEGPLRQELAALRIAGAKGDRGGVWFEGALPFALRALVGSRVAVRVLGLVGEGEAADAEGLYALCRTVAWADWLTTTSTFAVHVTGHGAAPAHSGFLALRCKDAVVDTLRERLGGRPDVDARRPEVPVVVHLDGRRAQIFLDLAGEPLHRRGTRLAMTEAPLKETLAAAVLVLGGAEVEEPFVDPMCGSGTLAIEHALRARRVAPGLSRRFAVERWPTFGDAERREVDRIRAEAEAAVLPRAPAPIVARDRDREALDAAHVNAQAAGVVDDITWERGDARELARRFERATLCTNPPYGERMGGAGPEVASAPPGGRRDRRSASPTRSDHDGDPRPGAPGAPDRRPAATAERQLVGFYRGFGEMLARLHGWNVTLLAGNPALLDALPVRPRIMHKLWNGPLEVRLLRFTVPHPG